MANPYKVFFHRGDRTEELTVQTKVRRGRAWVDTQGLHIASNSDTFLLPGKDILTVDMFRLHGVGRVLRIDHKDRRLFVSVVRLMVGQFAVINFLKTGALRDELAELAASAHLGGHQLL